MKSQPISHYRVRHKLGEGGMGGIRKAKDTILRRTEARQLLLPFLTADDQAVNEQPPFQEMAFIEALRSCDQRQALRGLAGLRNRDLRQLRG